MLIAIFLLSLQNNLFSATKFVVTVNKTGEDYNTIQLALNALVTNYTDGTVKTGNYTSATGTMTDAKAVKWDAGSSTGTLKHMTATQYLIDVTAGSLANGDFVSDNVDTFTVSGTPDSAIPEIDCYNDDGNLTAGWSTGSWTNDATNYLLITAPDSEKHYGIPGAGVVITGTGSLVVNTTGYYMYVEWLEFYGTTSSGTQTIIQGENSNSGDVQIFRNLIVHGSSTTGTTHGIWMGDTFERTTSIFNNIVYDCNGIGILGYGRFRTCTVENNTVYGCGKGFQAENTNSSVVIAKNNLSWLNTTDYNDTTEFNSASDYNMSKDNTSKLGAAAHYIQGDTEGKTPDFINVASDNYHIDSTSDAIDFGVDLGAGLGIEVDIDGRNRDSSGDVWDLGADEYVSGGAPARRRIMVIN